MRRADAECAANLQSETGVDLIMLQRVRLADEKPIAIETAYLRHSRFPDLLAGRDFSTESLYRVLMENYGVHLVWANQVIGARMPDRTERAVLELPPRTPVLSLQRVTYDDHNQPVEFVRSSYHSERYQLRTVLRELG